MTELLRVPGLGPKRVKALYRELEVKTLPQLLKAAEQGRIRDAARVRARRARPRSPTR